MHGVQTVDTAAVGGLAAGAARDRDVQRVDTVPDGDLAAATASIMSRGGLAEVAQPALSVRAATWSPRVRTRTTAGRRPLDDTIAAALDSA